MRGSGPVGDLTPVDVGVIFALLAVLAALFFKVLVPLRDDALQREAEDAIAEVSNVLPNKDAWGAWGIVRAPPESAPGTRCWIFYGVGPVASVVCQETEGVCDASIE